MTDLIDNMSFILPKGLIGIPQVYRDNANQMLVEFAEEINEQQGTVTVIVPAEGQWYFDFADIAGNLSNRVIARLESNGFSANAIKPYAVKMRGY